MLLRTLLCGMSFQCFSRQRRRSALSLLLSQLRVLPLLAFRVFFSPKPPGGYRLFIMLLIPLLVLVVVVVVAVVVLLQVLLLLLLRNPLPAG
jgi:hypothetical protein